MSETYKVYYSSRSRPDGGMWCPDCVVVEPTLDRTFNKLNGPPAEIIYVGDARTWRTPSNPHRQAPFKVTGVPTVLKFRGDEVVARIEDRDILDSKKMSEFLKV